jgi:hypothetical protein
MFRDLSASCIGAAVAEIITLPICTVKTNYQNSGKKTIWGTVGAIWGKHGIVGFYNAMPSAVGAQVVSSGSKFVIYRGLTRRLGDDPTWHGRLLCGTASGILSTLLTHPLDVMKIHVQMQASFRKELKAVGPRLFYRGYTKSFNKVLVASTLYMPLYDICKEKIGNPVGAALVSGLIATSVTHPIDYMKTRATYGLSYWAGWNPIRYYRGFTLNICRILPHFVIMMNTIDFIIAKWKI